MGSSLAVPLALIAALGVAATPLLPPRAAPHNACAPFPTPPATTAVANDNRARAGVLRDGVLTLRLVAQPVAWRPDGASGCALSVHAFAEEGKPTMVPGPLYPSERRHGGAGSRCATLSRQHCGSGDFRTVPLVARSTRRRCFPGQAVNSISSPRRQEPGTTGRERSTPVYRRPTRMDSWSAEWSWIPRTPEGQRGTIVFSSYTAVLTGAPGNKGFQLNAFNGRSWPNTERLTYTVNDSVRWQVINATNTTHEMHLHGFFFVSTVKGSRSIRPSLRGQAGARCG